MNSRYAAGGIYWRFFLWALCGGLCFCKDISAATLDMENWYNHYEQSEYAIELQVSEELLDHFDQRRIFFRFQILYLPLESFHKNNGVLRMGFFPDANAARDFLGSDKVLRSSGSIVHIDHGEYQAVIDEVKGRPGTFAGDKRYYVFKAATKLTDTSARALLEQAKDFYMGKHYDKARYLYALLSYYADTEVAAWALELQGLCYEKKLRFAEAAQVYQALLDKYPDLAGRARVEQRLLGVKTAALDENTHLRKVTPNQAKRYFFRGVFGQFQREMSRSANGGENEEVLSSLSTDFDVRAGAKWPGHDVNFRTNGYWLKDSLEADNDEFVLKRAYAEYTHRNSGTSFSVGRQKEFDSGVFTSFDGLTLSYPFTQNLTVSVAGGSPVYFSDVYEDLDLSFYSAYLNWDINTEWQLNSYLTAESLGSVTNREAFGARARYSNDNLSTALNVDYDFAFSELNSFLWNAYYSFNQRSNIAINYTRQRSPFLTASNILVGQIELDLELYLRSRENRDSLLDDALARTSINDYFSISYNRKLNDAADLFVDYYQSNLSEVPSSELLLGLESVSSETDEFQQRSWGARLVLQRVFFGNDIVTAGIRQNSGTNNSSIQVFVSEKLRLGNTLFINPKVSYFNIKQDTTDSVQNQFRYALLLTYRLLSNAEIYLEMGSESISWEGTRNSFDSDYVFFGYRVSLH